MRITGGHYRGRKLIVPKGRDIRPTSDKVRQAVFNILLQYKLPRGAHVLDLFCGTGALGLEALSRGAEFCTFIDKSRESLHCCQQNIKALDVEAQCKIMNKNGENTSEKPANMIPVNLAFIDPPYRQSLVLPALESLVKNGWLAVNALCVIECEKDVQLYVPEIFTLIKRKTYGDTQIIICRYGTNSPL